MQEFEKLEDYTNTVISQVRWEKARNSIAKELNGHMEDQKEAFIKEGISEEAAARKTIESMGDPYLLGAQFDQAHRPKSQKPMFFLTFLLIFAGMFMQQFTSGYIQSFPYFFFVAGVLLMFAAFRLDYTWVGKYACSFYFALLILSLFLLPFCRNINGEPHFLAFKLEYLTLLFPLAFAGLVYRMRGRKYTGIILCCLALVMLLLLSISFSFLSGSLMLLAVSFVILLAAILKDWFLCGKKGAIFIFLLPSAFLLLVILYDFPYFTNRFSQSLITFTGQTEYPSFIGDVIRNILSHSKLIGAGIITLPGLEKDAMTWFSANPEFILIFMIHKFGWLPFFLLSGVFMAFIVKGFHSVKKQKNLLGFFLSLSIMTTFTYQVINTFWYNFLFALSRPLSLPLVTHSNTAFIFNLILIGVMLSIFRDEQITKDALSDQSANRSFIRFENRQLVIDFNRK